MNSNEKNFEKIIEDLCITYRNIIKNHDLSIEFDDNLSNNFFNWNYQDLLNIHNDKEKINICLKTISKNFLINNDELITHKLRPSLDLAICFFKFHDPIIYQQSLEIFCNEFSYKYVDLFNNLERSRIIALSSDLYFGITKNIFKKLSLDSVYHANLPLDLLFLYKYFKNYLFLLDNDDTPNILFKNIEDKFSENTINQMRDLSNAINNQHQFALISIEILKNLIDKEIPANDIVNKNNNTQDQQNLDNNPNINEENNIEKEVIDTQENQEGSIINNSDNLAIESTNIAQNLEISIDNIINKSASEYNKIEFINPYQIFTNKFDEIIYPKKFVNKSELENLRYQLDLKISKLTAISKKIALKFKRKLLSKTNNYVDFDSSNGVLNRKRLTNLILSPFIEDIWVNNRQHQYNDTALTILLDNSGSMRGNPIVMSAMACEIIAEILEKFSVKTEIIGYTTVDWKGGKVRKLWEISGRPKNPGRLNQLRHIIYKDFNQNYKKSKINLGLMLKEGILKENIDGEAILFARYRLMQQNAKKKILIVISDGTPVDDATNANNQSEILCDHLKHVINIIERNNVIKIVGIGIGHINDEYYKNSITIKSVEELGDVLIDKIINAI
jgi:cobaltochelatase CobT